MWALQTAQRLAGGLKKSDSEIHRAAWLIGGQVLLGERTAENIDMTKLHQSAVCLYGGGVTQISIFFGARHDALLARLILARQSHIRKTEIFRMAWMIGVAALAQKVDVGEITDDVWCGVAAYHKPGREVARHEADVRRLQGYLDKWLAKGLDDGSGAPFYPAVVEAKIATLHEMLDAARQRLESAKGRENRS